ncbi:MAG: threonine--tRNA ligase [Armatimonadetes bacterium]|nr:threonine--tRNA ligase [Armatimonadota bacterium]
MSALVQEKRAYEQSELYKLRHSAAHLMAQAVTELFPGAKLAIGPPIENGFYYDIDFPDPIKEDALKKIEQRMKELAKLDMPIQKRIAKDRKEAKRIVLEECTLGQGEETALYKLELLDAIPEEDEVSFYEQRATDKQGNERLFIDLCRGPHIESTKQIKHFKLMSIAGAYWRGDVKKKMLTRIYGTAFESKDELHQYIQFLEEAKKRDHRKLGRELGLFMFSPNVGPGLALWLPKGAILRETLVNFLHQEQRKSGYLPVSTPHIASGRLFEKSGHLQTYRDKMYPLMEDEESETFVLKPMNCPFHIEMYASSLRSYRDLPIRYAEFGMVYRYEQSGEVAGLLRARGFTMDDAHLFMREDQLVEEFKRVVKLRRLLLDKLGITDYRVTVSTRGDDDSKYVGHIENWELAERAIIQACDELGEEYTIAPGEAAFYGPKLDLFVKDAIGREWQMGTVQVDYNLPERFDLEYIGEDSKPHRPIMIHRALYGSLERMIGFLTEHYAGAFPFWMSPVQVAVLPIADRHNGYAEAVASALRGYTDSDYEPVGETADFAPIEARPAQDLRVEVDARRETLSKKIRENARMKVPYMLIVGDNDIENATVGVRCRKEGDIGAMSVSEFVQRVDQEL